MAEEKKGGIVSLMNKGLRHFDTLGADGKPFRHSPGQIGQYTPEQAKDMTAYPDLIDISKLPGAVDTVKLKTDNAALLARQAELEAEVAALKGGKNKKRDAVEA